MAPGFRYHVVTIVAVFLALGVGMAVGSSFVQSAIVAQQTKKLEDLKQQFNSQVLVAQERNREYAEFAAKAERMLVDGRLDGRRVAIIQTGDYPDTAQKVREGLTLAGATAPSFTTIDAGYPTLAEAALPKLLAQQAAAHPNLPHDTTAPLRLVAAAVARGVQDNSLADVESAHLAQTQGDYSQPCDYVVLVGGASADGEGRADTVDAPLIAQLKSLGARVIEVEPSDAGISYVQALRSSDVTTVDNADTDIGRIAVVLALTAERGAYGVKPTAQNGILPTPTSALADDIRHRAGP